MRLLIKAAAAISDNGREEKKYIVCDKMFNRRLGCDKNKKREFYWI